MSTKEQQVRALEYLWTRLAPGHTQAAWARDLGVDPGTLSRALNRRVATLAGPATRLRLARWLGRQCYDAAALAAVVAASGWEWAGAAEPAQAEAALQIWQTETTTWGLPPQEQPLIGRTAELAALRAAILDERSTAPSVLVVQGLPGIGKSALVNQVVREPAVRQRFSDGLFWLRLEGQAEAVLWQELAGALGVELPRAAEQSLESWRRQLWGRLREQRVLVVADGVAGPLVLRGWTRRPRWRLIITTPRRDALDPAVWSEVWGLPVAGLAPAAAQELLTRGVAAPLAAAEAARLLAMLGGVPLALQIANRLAQQDGGWHWLSREMTPDNAVTYLDLYPGAAVPPEQERQVGVARAFGWSYRRLPPATAALFRFLGFLPSPFAGEAVAAIAGYPLVGVALRGLCNGGLLELERPGEYALHSLLHSYARQLLRQEDAAQCPAWEAQFVAYYYGQWLALARRLTAGAAAETWPEIGRLRAVWAQGYAYALARAQYAEVYGYLTALAWCTGQYSRGAEVAAWGALWQQQAVPPEWAARCAALWAGLWEAVAAELPAPGAAGGPATPLLTLAAWGAVLEQLELPLLPPAVATLIVQSGALAALAQRPATHPQFAVAQELRARWQRWLAEAEVETAATTAPVR